MSKRPNILIITFDCLRPDHLAGLGYKGTHTPTFDRFIEEGTTFERAYCQAPNTWISHASLFTGCNPYLHGMRTPLRKISSDLTVMAKVLRDAGYATFGLPAMSLLSQEAGFDRGFDEYVLEGLKSTPGVLAHRYDRPAGETLSRTVDWLRNASRPFFGWIHYFGIHKVEKDLFDLPDHYRRSYSPYAQYYDGKVAFADEHFLAPLTHELSELGLLDDTLIVLWSDHGEHLETLEHGLNWGHNWGLDDKVMRTVLIMRGPGILRGQRYNKVAQSIDIFPTLLDLVELPSLPQFEGQSLFQEDLPSERAIHMENLCQGFLGIQKGIYKLVFAHEQELQEDTLRWRIALLTKTMRRIAPTRIKEMGKRARRLDMASWCRVHGEPEAVFDKLLERGVISLYDLSEDPAESRNLAATHPDVVAELKLLLQENADRTIAGLEQALSDQEKEEVEERLRALGYL